MNPRQLAAKLQLFAAKLNDVLVNCPVSRQANWSEIPDPLRVAISNFSRDIQHDLGEYVRRRGVGKEE